MKIILICAATVKEAEACFPEMHSWPKFKNYSWVRRGKFGKYKGILAITGVGMPMTFMRLLPLAIDHQPDLILNIGIAGAYKNRDKKKNLSRKKNLGRAKTLEIGDTVFAQSECFGDMGMENPQAQEFGFTALGAMSWVDDIYKKPLPLNSLVFKDNIGEQIKSGKTKKALVVEIRKKFV